MDDLIRGNPYDLILTDTSLFQSLIAAAQSLKGKNIVQIDQCDRYGGPEAGSITIPLPSSTSMTYDPSPIIFYARGPLSETLLSLDLTEYIDFVAIDRTLLWPTPSTLIQIPLSKEGVMLESSLSLLDKRKLMKLLTLILSYSEQTSTAMCLGAFLRSEQVDPESRVFQLIAFSACRCSSLASVDRMPLSLAIKAIFAMKESISHLNRASPFVLPVWGSSELTQAACRKAAVNGCIQIIGKREQSEDQDSVSVSTDSDVNEIIVSLSNSETRIKSDKMIKRTECSSSDMVIYKESFLLESPVFNESSCLLITIPPKCELNPTESAFNILQLTSDSKCCPSGTGTFLIYIWTACEDPSLRCFYEETLVSIKERIIGTSTVLWKKGSHSLESKHIPHYTLSDGINTNDLNPPVPYQPILPASFESEEEFVTKLNLFSLNL